MTSASLKVVKLDPPALETEWNGCGGHFQDSALCPAANLDMGERKSKWGLVSQSFPPQASSVHKPIPRAASAPWNGLAKDSWA